MPGRVRPWGQKDNTCWVAAEDWLAGEKYVGEGKISPEGEWTACESVPIPEEDAYQGRTKYFDYSEGNSEYKGNPYWNRKLSLNETYAAIDLKYSLPDEMSFYGYDSHPRSETAFVIQTEYSGMQLNTPALSEKWCGVTDRYILIGNGRVTEIYSASDGALLYRIHDLVGDARYTVVGDTLMDLRFRQPEVYDLPTPEAAREQMSRYLTSLSEIRRLTAEEYEKNYIPEEWRE